MSGYSEEFRKNLILVRLKFLRGLSRAIYLECQFAWNLGGFVLADDIGGKLEGVLREREILEMELRAMGKL